VSRQFTNVKHSPQHLLTHSSVLYQIAAAAVKDEPFHDRLTVCCDCDTFLEKKAIFAIKKKEIAKLSLLRLLGRLCNTQPVFGCDFMYTGFLLTLLLATVVDIEH